MPRRDRAAWAGGLQPGLPSHVTLLFREAPERALFWVPKALRFPEAPRQGSKLDQVPKSPSGSGQWAYHSDAGLPPQQGKWVTSCQGVWCGLRPPVTLYRLRGPGPPSGRIPAQASPSEGGGGAGQPRQQGQEGGAASGKSLGLLSCTLGPPLPPGWGWGGSASSCWKALGGEGSVHRAPGRWEEEARSARGPEGGQTIPRSCGASPAAPGQGRPPTLAPREGLGCVDNRA